MSNDGTFFRTAPEVLEGYAASRALEAMLAFLMTDLNARSLLTADQTEAIFSAAAKAASALPKSENENVNAILHDQYARTIEGLRKAVTVRGN